MAELFTEQGYKYKGQPITPACIQDLILELFAGRLVERRTIVDEVLSTHIARGGIASRAEDFPRSVKKALSHLKQEGKAENSSYGYWRIAATAERTESLPEEQLSETNTAQIIGLPEGIDEAIDSEDSIADIVLGEGSGAVYLYYLPNYKASAEGRGELNWPCKIGRTLRDPLIRVLSQAATALPERPHIALILRTDMPGAWETAIKSALTIKGLRMEDSPGSEWFLTSPVDVLNLIHALDSRL
jgi:hypothetical protein